ncbi:Protein Networked (NET), actin-binding (NAB) domain containing protein [Trema orientale]|uniref:Protein Networked (NET), actin-binding (NAB) domain containing protein n=1 Tax=Trema orientale TaxID=63057 RepID=A0A2P5BPH5_TREOI|nr:Protein Networked (NET), actin-binding (NAB) domain containing protein [Trema orientale]
MTKRSLVSEMDKSVKRMLKLIEEDGDSFAKKAEMYYQKRPELISHVEEFYRMYRSLAERYDHVTGELRKNLPSDLHSQSSTISDNGSDVPSPDQRLGRRKSGTRAAGFDFFLGSGGNSDNYQREGDESSTLTDSEPESDDSSVNNYPSLFGNGGDQGLQRKILELEIELRDVKEKLRLQEEDNVDGSSRGHKNEYSEDSFARIAEYEQELRMANEKIHNSEEEIARLNIELQKYRLSEVNFALPDSSEQKEVKTRQPEMEMEVQEESDCQERFDGLEEAVDSDSKVQALVEELRITKGRLQVSENEITSLRYELARNKSSDQIQQLQKQLESAQKDVATWKAKLNVEKREVSKLQERVTRLKTSLTDRDHEIRDLKLAVSDAEQKIFPEKAQVKAEISKLLEERIHFEQQLKDLENQGRCLEEEIRKIKAEKSETEERLNGVIEHLKAEVNERGNSIETLNKILDSLKTERDGLNARVSTLKADVSTRDDHIDQLNEQLIEAQKERIELIAEAQGAQKLVKDLKSRTRELEEEVERQRVVILEGAEEKREAIRQLCFSIEHYRNGYHRLRNAVIGHKRVPVLAS